MECTNGDHFTEIKGNGYRAKGVESTRGVVPIKTTVEDGISVGVTGCGADQREIEGDLGLNGVGRMMMHLEFGRGQIGCNRDGHTRGRSGLTQ